eukprot:TRINITY_DN1078_c0_g1_i2.p1 TRINITY_DN1078_c0_g1~~TRINITY_DN1078_c0_g1_i2.p1  ORF type:complete len:357 (+),score=57.78 TRINITY_DN1078_c0_g1_i2:511-1581(+)
MLLLIFGALTGFIVIIGNVVQPILDEYIKKSFFTAPPVVLFIGTVVIILPLCLLRDIGKLEYSSILAIVLIVLFVGYVAVISIIDMVNGKVPWNEVLWANFAPENFFEALPIISLAYTCQISLFPIWKELENPTPSRINTVSIAMVCVSVFCYLFIGFFGYTAYLNLIVADKASNILLVIGDNVFMNVIRGLFAVVILCHYPVVHFAFRNSVEETFFGSYKFNWARHCIITIVTVMATLTLAIVMLSLNAAGALGKVFDLTGSFAAFPINFILPVLFYIKVFLIDGRGADATLWHDNNYWNDPTEAQHLLSSTQPEAPGAMKSRLLSKAAILPYIMLLITGVCCIISMEESVRAFF